MPLRPSRRSGARLQPRATLDYQAKISGPLFDRISLHMDVAAARAADLTLPPPAEGAAETAERVAAARQNQAGRSAVSELKIRTTAEADGTLLEAAAAPD